MNFIFDVEYIARLREEIAIRNSRAAAIGRLIKEIEDFKDIFTEFTEESWIGLGERITVKDDGSFLVRFKSGYEMSV